MIPLDQLNEGIQTFGALNPGHPPPNRKGLTRRAHGLLHILYTGSRKLPDDFIPISWISAFQRLTARRGNPLTIDKIPTFDKTLTFHSLTSPILFSALEVFTVHCSLTFSKLLCPPGCGLYSLDQGSTESPTFQGVKTCHGRPTRGGDQFFKLARVLFNF